MNVRVTLAVLAFALLVPMNLVAQDKTKPAADADKLDKKVLEIVKQVGDLYKNAKNIHAEGTLSSKVERDGEKQDFEVTAIYDVERPNRLSLKTKFDGDAKKGPDVIADGKNLFIYRKALKQYTEQESPKGLADIGMSVLRLGPVSAGMLFGNILGDDPAELLMQGVTSCTYVGKDKVDGTPVHRMKFTQGGFDWELWVAAEGKPFVLRMISTTQAGKVITTETYKNWKVDEAPAKDTFTFTAPEDTTKVKAFEQPKQEK